MVQGREHDNLTLKAKSSSNTRELDLQAGGDFDWWKSRYMTEGLPYEGPVHVHFVFILLSL